MIEYIVFIALLLSFLSGLMLGYQLGFKSKRFKGTFKGKHNIKLLKFNKHENDE